MPENHDPSIFRPLLEQLSASAISALRTQPGPCWTAAIIERVLVEESDPDPSLSIGSIWTLRDRPGRALSPHSDIAVPVDPTSVLEAAADVARFKGRTIVGWHLDTYVGCRAWLVETTAIEEEDGEAIPHGRSNVCMNEFQDGARVGPPMIEAPSRELRPLYLALRVLWAADRLESSIELDGDPTSK